MTEQKYAKKMIAEYGAKQPSKVDELKKLDCRAKKPPMVIALIMGIAGCLIFGLGLCLAMQIIGKTVPFMILGIILGIVGGAVMGVTYPVYSKMLESRKRKFASQILAASQEILEEND